MPSKSRAKPRQTQPQDADAVVASLKRLATKRTRDGMARYGIPSDNAFGVTVGQLHLVAKRLGRNHDLAAALWETGWYEARMLCAFIGEPARVTPAQMDRWAKDFDSWAICDTICFHLWDKPPIGPALAFRKIKQWSGRKGEFQKRAAFALLASLALHFKPREAEEDAFLRTLPFIEGAATDDRNFVKKGVSWALRGVGRRTPTLRAASIALAKRLAAASESVDGAARWVGRDVLRDLTKGR